MGLVSFSIKVLTECQQDGHDWSEATCVALSTCSRCRETRGELLPHTGGKATCRSGAICEVCGNAYGNRDWNTHPDGATPVWNVEEWGDNAGHQSKWSCCGQVEYQWEYFDGLSASEFRTKLELTLIKDGKAISEAVTYSLDTYAQNRLAASTDANFKALLEATLRYADSAKEYFLKLS